MRWRLVERKKDKHRFAMYRHCDPIADTAFVSTAAAAFFFFFFFFFAEMSLVMTVIMILITLCHSLLKEGKRTGGDDIHITKFVYTFPERIRLVSYLSVFFFFSFLSFFNFFSVFSSF